MILSRQTLKNISQEKVNIPGKNIFELPEKVLQFGTGVLLRGLPDYFIDKANKMGIFNGRIVVVKSTDHGDTTAFNEQDNLYTLCIRGTEDNQKIEENIINASISRVLTAQSDWNEVLKCAQNPNIQIIISNTTEVGIQLVHEVINNDPPKSFPGKLLALLFKRYQAFAGSRQSGMVIIPTELLPDNGKKLKSIVLELAHLNKMEDTFINWIDQGNFFCSSLVDRIVPGKPDPAFQTLLEKELGYTDQLMTMAEVYRLWAIEGDDFIKDILSFYPIDEGICIEPDINLYRELKLRLLNGTHTLSCGLAFLAGFETVKQAMDNLYMSSYIANLMQYEIAPAIPYNIDAEISMAFASKVLDRFRNPHIKHPWINITLQYSSKMKMRSIPVLLKHYQLTDTPPRLFAFGFAAYLLFMKSVKKEEKQYFGKFNDQYYPVQDDMAEIFYSRWNSLELAALVDEVLKDATFWGADLRSLPGFYDAVCDNLELMLSRGVKPALETIQLKKIIA